MARLAIEPDRGGEDLQRLEGGSLPSEVQGLNPNDPSPDYANWSGTWKAKPEGKSVKRKGPLPPDEERCALAIEFVTAAEEKLLET